jgi:hypothetical protein
MKFRVTFNILHLMVGISFVDRHNTLISLGPVNVWIHHSRRYRRDIENQIMQNAGVK